MTVCQGHISQSSSNTQRHGAAAGAVQAKPAIYTITPPAGRHCYGGGDPPASAARSAASCPLSCRQVLLNRQVVKLREGTRRLRTATRHSWHCVCGCTGSDICTNRLQGGPQGTKGMSTHTSRHHNKGKAGGGIKGTTATASHACLPRAPGCLHPARAGRRGASHGTHAGTPCPPCLPLGCCVAPQPSEPTGSRVTAAAGALTSRPAWPRTPEGGGRVESVRE
jgi:hypothetical protein